MAVRRRSALTPSPFSGLWPEKGWENENEGARLAPSCSPSRCERRIAGRRSFSSPPPLAGDGLGARALAALLLAVAFIAPAVAQQAAGTPRPAIVIESAQHCIAPPEVMRREHPDMLRHQRDRTVHLGERGARVSLKGCIACHASRETGSVVGSDRAFCQSCHSYAAVRIDCFDCHQPTVQPALASLAGGARK